MRRATQKIIRDYGLTVCVAIAVAFLIRTFFIEAYHIPSSAMKPTLLAGDTLFVTKSNALPRRGDVVVFSGKDQSGAYGLDYIKRVVGLPKDQIAIRDGRIILNGVALTTTFQGTQSTESLPGGTSYSIYREASPLPSFGPEIVPAGSVFVIGDNRSRPPASKDKKKLMNFGIIPLSTIKGKASWIWLSIQPQDEIQKPTHGLPRFRLDRMFKKVQ